MKKFLSSVANKVAEVANEVSAYNSPEYLHQQQLKQALKEQQLRQAQQQAAKDGDGEVAFDPFVEHLLRNVRSRLVRKELASTPQAEYTTQNDVTLLTATFNVNGKKPPAGLSLEPWLGPSASNSSSGVSAGSSGCAGPQWPKGAGSGGSSEAHRPDIVAVGFQEIVPLNAGSVIGVLGAGHAQEWDARLAAHLNGEAWAALEYGSATQQVPLAMAMDSKFQGITPPSSSPSSFTGAAAAAGMQQGSSSAAGAAYAGVAGGEPAYLQVVSRQMVGVYLSVWVKRGLLPAVRGVQVTSVATGFGGYVGNKGAVAARLQVFDTSLAVVAAHLSSGEGEADAARRNMDVAEILRRASFAFAYPMTSAAAARNAAKLPPGHWRENQVAITDHDVVVWVGDLNYRLNMQDEDARRAMRAGVLEQLIAADQLVTEMALNRVFQGWREGAIKFMPTFKFRVGTHLYLGDPVPANTPALSTLSLTSGGAAPSIGASPPSMSQAGVLVDAESDFVMVGDEDASGAGAAETQKRRTPAWCDRVLWRDAATVAAAAAAAVAVAGRSGVTGHLSVQTAVQPLAYWRGEIATSDHKPVAAGFVMHAREYDRRRLEGLLEAARRKVDMMQAALRPRCAVDVNVLQADTVTYGSPVRMSLTLTNSGTVGGFFHFVPVSSVAGGGGGSSVLDDESPALPAWLSATPAEGMVEPGGQATITLTVLVEGGPSGASQLATASAANADGTSPGKVDLDTIVILRIEDSGDKFITVTGSLETSFLGLSPAALARRYPTAGDLQVHLPTPVAALLAFLERSDCLATGGILVDSCAEMLCTSADAATTGQEGGLQHDTSGLSTFRARQRALLQALEPVRAALDQSSQLPPDTSPHQAAALLLTFLGELPRPLMPQALADFADAQADRPLQGGAEGGEKSAAVAAQDTSGAGSNAAAAVVLPAAAVEAVRTAGLKREDSTLLQAVLHVGCSALRVQPDLAAKVPVVLAEFLFHGATSSNGSQNATGMMGVDGRLAAGGGHAMAARAAFIQALLQADMA